MFFERGVGNGIEFRSLCVLFDDKYVLVFCGSFFGRIFWYKY